MLILEGFVVFIEVFDFSIFSVTGWGIDLDYYDIEWFALEMNRDHSVIFEKERYTHLNAEFQKIVKER